MPGYVDIGRSEVDILELGSLGYLSLYFFSKFSMCTQKGKQIFYNYFGHELEPFSSTTKTTQFIHPFINHTFKAKLNISLYELGRSPCS